MSLWLRIQSNAGPLLLLSVLSSVAFNRALLAREREEQSRLHRYQISFLQEILSGSNLRPSTIDEEHKLARRLKSLHLDPTRLGISSDAFEIPSREATSWSTAFFGQGVFTKIKQGFKAVQGHRSVSKDDDEI